MGKDLDRLADVITGALQEADEERLTDGAKPRPGAGNSRGEMRVNKDPPAGMLLNQDQDLKPDGGPDLNPKEAVKLKQQGWCLCCWKSEKAGQHSDCIIDLRA